MSENAIFIIYTDCFYAENKIAQIIFGNIYILKYLITNIETLDIRIKNMQQ